ncbi:AraC family transcriptional regulator [Pseudoclostridium thermosuccinogenes]|uniref:AraC family transcriptional regulator n=1 Tax=Clostridium thermosuccinogenes TaxID=84032 RepID=UPI002FDA7AE6
MDWVAGMQKAIDYIEEHITDKLDYEQIAAQTFISSYHFQRAFSIMCGFTLGEYIRKRRLTLAGNELLAGKKVVDVAMKYGYDSPDSFAKAFARFHGVAPSSVCRSKVQLKSLSRLSIKVILEGGCIMNYRIEQKPILCLVGYKARFKGDAGERFEQEKDFWVNTRKEQDIIAALRDTDENIWYDINVNFSDDGYDHYIAVISDKEPPQGFYKIEIPAATYVVCETEKAKYPTLLHCDLRKKIVSEWLPSSGYQLANSPEIAVTHWYKKPNDSQRFIEIWLPIEKK